MKKDVAELLKTIGESFLALSEIYSSTTEDASTPKEKTKKQKTTKADKTAPVEETPAEPTAKTYSKEEVRAMLSQKAKLDGCKYKAEVKAIVSKYSTDGTLTNVPADKYSELVSDLEVVGNA